jgi:hypothetical protein
MTRAILALAKSIDPSTIAAYHPNPQIPKIGRAKQGEIHAMTAAVDAYRALKNPKWGDQKRIAISFGVSQAGMHARMNRHP